VLVESKTRAERDEFRKKLKEQWGLMWRERFDDKLRGEGVGVRDYPLLFVDRGSVIFASRDAKSPSFPEIVQSWAAEGSVYSPDPSVGGWGRFIRTELSKVVHSRARGFGDRAIRVREEKRQQPKKGGRGWLHT